MLAKHCLAVKNIGATFERVRSDDIIITQMMMIFSLTFSFLTELFPTISI